jgi:multiple sugar transport system ATP-binding protein
MAGAKGRDVILGARHSALRLFKDEVGGSVLGRVYTVEPTGDITFVHVQLGAATITVSVPPEVKLAPNDPIWIAFDQDKVHLFDGENGLALKAA